MDPKEWREKELRAKIQKETTLKDFEKMGPEDRQDFMREFPDQYSKFHNALIEKSGWTPHKTKKDSPKS